MMHGQKNIKVNNLFITTYSAFVLVDSNICISVTIQN